MSDQGFAEVGDVIAHGEAIPANVVRMIDRHAEDEHHAVWVRVGTDPLRFIYRDGTPDGHPWEAAWLQDRRPAWFPFTVVEVDPEPQPAEPKRDVEDDVHYYVPELRPGATFCGIGLEEDSDLSTTDEPGKATCDTCRAEADEDAIGQQPDPAPSGLCEVGPDGVNCIVDQPDHRRIYHGGRPKFLSHAEVLDEAREADDYHLMKALGVDRLDEVMPAIERLQGLRTAGEIDRALIAQVAALLGASEGDNIVECLSWLVRRVGDQGREFLALSAELEHAQRQRDEARAEVERLTPAESGPVVLSLPQVPDGAVALVDRNADRWTAQQQPGRWRRSDGMSTTLPLLLENYGPATVEFAPPREPRTWPKLDPAPDDVRTVQIIGGPNHAEVWRRDAGMSLFRPADEPDGAALGLAELRELGEVREVLT